MTTPHALVGEPADRADDVVDAGGGVGARHLADHGGMVEPRAGKPARPGDQLGDRRAVRACRRLAPPAVKSRLVIAAPASAGAAGSSAVSITPTGCRAGQPAAGQPSSPSA